MRSGEPRQDNPDGGIVGRRLDAGFDAGDDTVAHVEPYVVGPTIDKQGLVCENYGQGSHLVAAVAPGGAPVRFEQRRAERVNSRV